MFCGYVDVWGKKLTSFMTFMVMLMCEVWGEQPISFFFLVVMSMFEVFCYCPKLMDGHA
jgi:hypothetical protein